jgi:hypothetical protein
MIEYGPVYGVELITDLPLDGGMLQAMPSRRDLLQVRDINERTVAGYEVLLEHYHRLQAAANSPDLLGEALEALTHCHDWILSQQTSSKEGERIRLEARAVLEKGGVR